MQEAQAKARHGGSKHEAVFRAAKAVFIQRGYDAASMDEIAALAGTTKATVYAHAGSKAALFRATLREAVELSAGKIQPPDAAHDARTAIELFLARFVEIACWQGSVGLQRTALAALDRFPEHGAMIMEQVVVPATDALAYYLEQRGIEHHREKAAMLIEAATGRRRFATLMGMVAPLAAPPVVGRVQEGAMDEAIRFAVSSFLRANAPRLSPDRPGPLASPAPFA